MSTRKVPDVVIRRLPLYLRVLDELDAQFSPIISSRELGEKAGVTSGQVRKDLSFFGVFGKQGVGYYTSTLRAELRRILSLHRVINVGLVGVGNLGQALLRYRANKQKRPGAEEGLSIIAAFDKDKRKCGQQIAGVKIYPVEQMPELIQELKLSIMILTVPADAAPAVLSNVYGTGRKPFSTLPPLNWRPQRRYAFTTPM